jgi:hypothetical protein
MPRIDTDAADKKNQKKNKTCYIHFNLLDQRFYILIYSR